MNGAKGKDLKTEILNTSKKDWLLFHIHPCCHKVDKKNCFQKREKSRAMSFPTTELIYFIKN